MAEETVSQKSLSCETCGKVFKVSRNLRVHMRIHSGEKPFVCETCGKAFNQVCSLKRHTRIHTGDRPYTCTTCGKSFKESGKLKLHNMIHTGEKPRVCEKCGTRFTTGGDLRKHMMIHTGEKPFGCSACGKTFNRKSDMKRHKTVHLGRNAEKYRRRLKRKEISEFDDVSFSYVICVPPLNGASNEGVGTRRDFTFCDRVNVIATSDVVVEDEIRCCGVDMFHGRYGSCPITLYVISKPITSVDFQHFVHPNIVTTYGLAMLHDHRFALVLDNIAMNLEQLLVEFNDKLTLREQVDLSLGCASAIDYLHCQIGISHGLLTCRNVFVTNCFTAKVADPVAVRLMAGYDATPTVTMENDLVQLGSVLLKLFGVVTKTELNNASSSDGLQTACSLYGIMEYLVKEDRTVLPSSKDVVTVLDSMRQTDQYKLCPAKRAVGVSNRDTTRLDVNIVVN